MARITVVWRRELGVLAVNWTDILDGEIVNAAWAVAGMVARPRAGRNVAASMDTAAWADTERLIRDALAGIAADPEWSALSEDESAELAAAVRQPEVQGALQALLAVRLTDAPETDAARAREAVRLALATGAAPAPGHPSRNRRQPATAQVPRDEAGPSPRLEQRWLEQLGSAQGSSGTLEVERKFWSQAAEPASARYARRLSEYFDDKISALVAALEGRVGFAGLAQVRAEAYNARIVALLGAIERQVTALADPGRGSRAEAGFLDRYRRQARLRHGFLTPPDFDRRRRVPAPDIYVPTWISEDDQPEQVRQSLNPEPDSFRVSNQPGRLKVWDLADRLDRTVLLGDPGGGKTTAANVLTDHFARGVSTRIAFLVTLRDYAAKTPIEWSVAEHIEHNLKTLYQVTPPDGLVERLLLTGRAVVIFDGLDELLDTSRRRDVSGRVEQYASAYPLTPVLVTSRVVGYDQARLDEAQFSCYRLAGFGDAEATQYAGKWFGTQEGLAPAEAAAKARAFLAESAHARDLRANPLLLSLMCILYRGAGSLPGDRAGVYARAAELLLRKWDEQRDLYRKLGSDHLVEPTLRFLAWWLFTREDSRTSATERELIAKSAEFLYERGYETEEQARAAAREFVEFCRGRMWVFSDAGTTADGERLYGFTHRTFLEYFAAWHLAVTSDSPEDLARTLAPRVATRGWTTVAELAIKIKSDASDRGTDRVYATLLDPALAVPGTEALFEFLVAILPTTRPAPATLRKLASAALDHALNRAPQVYLGLDPLTLLLYGRVGVSRDVVLEELGARIADRMASGDAAGRASVLRVVLSMAQFAGDHAFSRGWAVGQYQLYAAEIAAAALEDSDLRALALDVGVLAVRDALAMPGSLTALATAAPVVLDSAAGDRQHRIKMEPYVSTLARALMMNAADAGAISGVTAIGHHLLDHPEPPWVRGRGADDESLLRAFTRFLTSDGELPVLEQGGNLGVAAVMGIVFELHLERFLRASSNPAGQPERGSRSGHPLPRYLSSRLGADDGELPDLPVPAPFGRLFRDWAAHRVNFVELTGQVADEVG